MMPQQNGCHFAVNNLKYIFFKEGLGFFLEVSFTFVYRDLIDNNFIFVFSQHFHFSTLISQRHLKSFLVGEKDALILHNQYHGC